MIWIAITAAGIIFFGDLWIKNKVESAIGDNETREKLGGRLLIRKYHNKGAMLNLGEGWRPEKGYGRKAVAGLSAVLCIVLSAVFLLSFTKSGSSLMRAGLTLLLGGAFSNTYDRLKRKYVVDYFSFGGKGGRFSRIVFNISDFCIIIGALMAAAGFGTANKKADSLK